MLSRQLNHRKIILDYNDPVITHIVHMIILTNVNSYLHLKAIQQPQPNQRIANNSYQEHCPNPIAKPKSKEQVYGRRGEYEFTPQN